MESVKSHSADSQALRANKLALVERLADDLAHEIKNPLHSMVINLEVLKRRVSRWSGADATELMRYVGILSDELDRVSRRIDLLLRMVRTDRGGDPASLVETVEDLLELVELERERHRVSFEFRPPERPPRAYLPRDTARQIVLNLLLIGIDEAGRGGMVTISSPETSGEEELRLLAAPSGTVDRSAPGGVAEGHAMRAAARALVDPLGGTLDVSSSGERDGAVEIVVTLPLNAG